MKEKIKSGLKWFYESNLWIGVLLLIGDLVSKLLVVKYRDNILNGGGRHGGVDIIPGFLGVNYVINNKLALGINLGNDVANRAVFIVFALLISAGIITYLVFKWSKTRRLYKAVAFMIIAGALGNTIDRIFYTPEFLGTNGVQGVVDWIDFYGIWGFNFNVADSSVVVAAFILIISFIVDAIKEAVEKKKSEPKEKKPVEKVVSKTELERQQLREKDKIENE